MVEEPNWQTCQTLLLQLASDVTELKADVGELCNHMRELGEEASAILQDVRLLRLLAKQARCETDESKADALRALEEFRRGLH